ncbi:unnamed protein product [Nesidiocoris tenuis]|nr:unnamed protein product [Nesidiocoris tenuis]
MRPTEYARSLTVQRRTERQLRKVIAPFGRQPPPPRPTASVLSPPAFAYRTHRLRHRNLFQSSHAC